MAVSDSQIYDLINKVNIIYNVVNNTLDARVSSVTGNVINSTNYISNRLNQTATQARSDTTYAINQIGQYINTSTGQVYKDITFATNNISNTIQLKINAVSQDIQKKIDASNLVIGEKLNTINSELKQQITTIINPILQEVVKSTKNITDNINNSIISFEADTKQASITTNNIIKDTTANILNKITELSKVTTELGGTAQVPKPTTSGAIPGNDPNNPYNALETVLADIRKNNNHPNDSFFSSFIRVINGDQAADTINQFTLPNISHALSNQVSQISTIIDRASKGQYKSLDDFTRDFKSLGVNTDFIGGLLQFLFIVPSLLNIGNQLSGAFNTRIAQLTNATYELQQLDSNEIVLAFIRNLITYQEAIDKLKQIGHKQEDSELILKEAFPKFNVDELFRLAHLGKIDGETLIKRVRELGFNEIDAILQGYLKQPRPGINDLIQFAVKEVYSPETYNKFGQYLEFPKDFAEQSKLLGLDEQFAKQYWAAHWDLPSPTMGYDMLHRGIINQEDLKALLKALDVMPFWRDKLIQLSYNIVARVDTRRLYAYGIWDKNKVYQNYLHEGYSPEDANSLTQFTIQYDDEQDNKHKSKLQTAAHNVYIKSFKYGLIDRQTALNKIVALGYKENDIKLELDLEQYENYVDSHKPKKENHVSKIVSISLDGYRKRAVSKQTLLDTLTQNGYTQSEANTEIDFIDREIDIIFKENIVKEIQKLYFESLYDDNAVLTRLTNLGFSNSEILKIISELKILKGLDVKKPSQTQFEKMVKKGFISGLEYAKILAEMGYNEKYIPYLVQLASAVD